MKRQSNVVFDGADDDTTAVVAQAEHLFLVIEVIVGGWLVFNLSQKIKNKKEEEEILIGLQSSAYNIACIITRLICLTWPRW